MARGRKWADAMIVSQHEDGQFGPRTNTDWWPRMVALKVLAQHFEATHDARVLPLMERYFEYQVENLPAHPVYEWGQARVGENLLVLAWFMQRSSSPDLQRLARVADLLAEQGLDWGGRLAEGPPLGFTRAWDPWRHVVNVAMGLKLPAVRYLFDADPQNLAQLRHAVRNIDRHHGQVTGMFSGDEWLAGRSPYHGVELCAVVEFMFTLETVAEITGESWCGDRLEEIAYNTLPATITADMRAHQYLQQPNQVACTIAPRRWTCSTDDANIFGFEPHFGCCTANLHQGWPKFAGSLWMGVQDGGLAAVAYAPCRVETPGRAIDVVTDYPFSDTISVQVRVPGPTMFPLHLRIPAWCDQPGLVVAGEDMEVQPRSGYAVVERAWRDGDVVLLKLPGAPRAVSPSPRSVAVKTGPLLLALPVGEDWRQLPDRAGLGDWEVYPTTAWNYGLAISGAGPLANYRARRGPVSSPPFGAPSLRVEVVGQRVENWDLRRNSAGPVPAEPAVTPGTQETIGLVPYGCARLRVAEFPRLR